MKSLLDYIQRYYTFTIFGTYQQYICPSKKLHKTWSHETVFKHRKSWWPKTVENHSLENIKCFVEISQIAALPYWNQSKMVYIITSFIMLTTYSIRYHL